MDADADLMAARVGQVAFLDAKPGAGFWNDHRTHHCHRRLHHG
jgi:hypothetical protein